MSSSSRTRNPSPGERAVSVGVLAVLAGVLAYMLVAQGRFSPAVLVAESLAHEAHAPAVAAPPDLLASWPAGLTAMGAAESFPETTLSDKIDGKAELYHSAGFVRLDCQRVKIAGGAGSWLEMFVYDMGVPANAYAVWSSQKRPDASEAGLADYSYRADNELCLVYGKYYVEMVGSDTRAETAQAAQDLARAFVAKTGATEHANMGSEQALFPEKGLVAGSVALVPADVFGSEGLKSVFVAHYREGSEEAALFMARRASPADAKREATDFHAFLVQDCGGKDAAPTGPISPTPPADTISVVDMGGSFDAVFVAGPFLAGVHQAPTFGAAQRWAELLRHKIEGGQR